MYSLGVVASDITQYPVENLYFSIGGILLVLIVGVLLVIKKGD